MSRDLATAISGALGDQEVSVFWACDLLFDSPNDLYFWSGIGDLVLDGKTYVGAGDLLGISELRESSDIAAYGATLTLSGIPSSIISVALAEPYQGRRAIVKFGFRFDPVNSVLYDGTWNDAKYWMDTIGWNDSGTLSVLTNAFTVFTGEMDEMNIQFGADTVTISLAVESRLVDLNRPRIRRYTDADQQSRFGGDMAFEFVTRLQDEDLQWAG